MRAGVRLGRIVTTLAGAPRAPARRRRSRADAHYVYRRTGLPCRVCGTAGAHRGAWSGRNLYWCPVCQVRLNGLGHGAPRAHEPCTLPPAMRNTLRALVVTALAPPGWR